MAMWNEQLRYRYSASLIEVSGQQGAPVTGPNGAQTWLQHGPGFNDRRILTSAQGQQVPAEGYYQKFELLRRMFHCTQADMYHMQGLLAELVPTQPGYYGTPSFPRHDAWLPEANRGTAFSSDYYMPAGPHHLGPSYGHPPAWNTMFAQASAPGPIGTVNGPPGAGNQANSQACNVRPPPSTQGGLWQGPSTSAAAMGGLLGSQQPNVPTGLQPPSSAPAPSDNSGDAVSAHQQYLNARMELQNQNLVGNQGLPVARIRLHLGAGPSTSSQQGDAGIVVPDPRGSGDVQMHVHIKGFESASMMGTLPRDVPTLQPPTTRTGRSNTTSSRPAYVPIVPYSSSEGTIAPLNSCDECSDQEGDEDNQQCEEDGKENEEDGKENGEDGKENEEDHQGDEEDDQEDEDDDEEFEDDDEQDTAPPHRTSPRVATPQTTTRKRATRRTDPRDEYSKITNFLSFGTSFGSIKGNDLGSYEVSAADGIPPCKILRATSPEQKTPFKIENTQGLNEQPAGAPGGKKKKLVTASHLRRAAKSLGKHHQFAAHWFGRDASDRTKQEFQEKGGVPCGFCEIPVLRLRDAYHGSGCQCGNPVYHRKCTRALVSEFMLTGKWPACKRCGDMLLPKIPPGRIAERLSNSEFFEITIRRLLRDAFLHRQLLIAGALPNPISP